MAQAVTRVRDCGVCGSLTQVTDSREVRLAETTGIRRRRQCPQCQTRFSTVEIVMHPQINRALLEYSAQGVMADELDTAIAALTKLRARWPREVIEDE